METIIIWYWLLLKQQLKRWTFWLQLAIYIVVLLLLGTVHTPGSENCNVAIYIEDAASAKELYKRLEKTDSIFIFVQKDSKEALEESVMRGEVECGFVLTEDLEKALDDEKPKEAIEFVYSTFGSKALVARETVTAQFYALYSEHLLANQQEYLFGTNKKAIAEKISERNQYYLHSDEIFRAEFVDIKGKEVEAEVEKELQPQLIRGVVGLLLFMSLLFVQAEELYRKDSACWMFFQEGKRRMFRILRYISAVTPQLVIGFLCIRIYDATIPIALDAILLLLYLGLSMLWVTGFGKLFHKETVYFGWLITVILIQVVLCPVIWDVGAIQPALGIPKYLFPLGIYLRLVQILAL